MANAIPVHGTTSVGDNEVFAELEKNAPKRKAPKRAPKVQEFDNEAAAAAEGLEFANDPQEFQKTDDQPRRPSGALLGEMLNTGRRRGVKADLPVRKHMEGKTSRVDW